MLFAGFLYIICPAPWAWREILSVLHLQAGLRPAQPGHTSSPGALSSPHWAIGFLLFRSCLSCCSRVMLRKCLPLPGAESLLALRINHLQRGFSPEKPSLPPFLLTPSALTCSRACLPDTLPILGDAVPYSDFPLRPTD